MLVLSLISLAVATITACLSLNSQEDVVKAAMGFTALLATLLTLFLAPWILKLLIVSVPLAWDKLYHWSAENSIN